MVSPRSWLRRALSNESASLLVVGRLAATFLAFATAPIVARAIGPEGRGETAAAIALFFIVPIVMAMGVPMAVRRLAARGQHQEALRAARSLVLASAPLAILIALIAYVTILANFPPEARVVGAVGIALAPLMMSWTCDLSVLIAAGRFRGVMMLQVIQPLTYLLLVIAFLAIGSLTVATVLVANIAGNAAAFVTGALLSRVSPFGARLPLSIVLRDGVRFAGSSIAEAASSRLDQVLALPLIGAFQAGIYSVAVTVSSIPLAVGQALAASYFTEIVQGDDSGRASSKKEAMRVAIAAALMVYPLIFFGAWIGIPLLFGPGFLPAVSVAWALGVGTSVLIVAQVASTSLAAEGRGRWMMGAQVTGLTGGVVALFLLAPPFGAAGAALASVLGSVALMVVLYAGLGVGIGALKLSSSDLRLAVRRLVRGRSDPRGEPESEAS